MPSTNYAVVDESFAEGDSIGEVTNLISGDDLAIDFLGDGFLCIEVTEETGDAEDGYTVEETDGEYTFIAPPPTQNELLGELTQQISNYKAAYNFTAVSLNVDIDDPDFLAWLHRSYTIAAMQSSSSTHKLVQADLSYASISNANLIALFDDIATYRQKGDDAAASVYAAIIATTLTTFAAVDGAWSSALSATAIPTTTEFIATLQSDVSGLKTSRTTDEGNITSLFTSKSTDESNITSLQSSRTTDEANITALQGAVARTTTNITPSIVGTGATGAQVSSTKASTVRLWLHESVTSNIGGAATATINIKVCTTNNATEASWTTLATFEEDQTVTLALALQSVQVMNGELTFDLPAGMFWKPESAGSGTNAESILNGQQTIYG